MIKMKQIREPTDIEFLALVNLALWARNQSCTLPDLETVEKYLSEWDGAE